MTQLLPPPQREEFDAEAIVKEARRLRRRRWLIGTIVTVVVIASIAAAITLSSHNGTQSPPPVTFEGPPSLLPGQAPLDQSILVSPAGLSHGSMSGRGALQLTVVDPANGTDRLVQPFSGNPLFTFPWIASGDEVVAVNGLNGTAGSPQVGTAAAFSPTRPQAIRTLGRASYVVDAYGPGDVWLVVDPSFDIGALAAASGCTVEEVSLAGRVHRRATFIPVSLDHRRPGARRTAGDSGLDTRARRSEWGDLESLEPGERPGRSQVPICTESASGRRQRQGRPLEQVRVQSACGRTASPISSRDERLCSLQYPTAG